MTTIFLKVLYLFLIISINLYIGAYLVNKISSRSEHRRGFSMGKAGGFGYPAFKMLKYLEKSYKINIWQFLLLFLSFFIWAIIPFSTWLVLIKIEGDLIIALLFYMMLIFIFLINSSRSSYETIYHNVSRNVLMAYSFEIPVIFCISSLVLINRTLNLKEIVGFQYQFWNIVYQPLGFVVFFTSIFLQIKLFSLTKTNNLIFRKNSEKEISGFGRFILRVANYNIFYFLIVLIIILYLAGWQNVYFLNGNILFILKFYIIFIVILLLDRATPLLDDYKYLISINWKFLIPVAVANFLLTLVFFILRNVYSLI